MLVVWFSMRAGIYVDIKVVALHYASNYCFVVFFLEYAGEVAREPMYGMAPCFRKKKLCLVENWALASGNGVCLN